MIYLIDDKKSRQADYGWNLERFTKFSSVIQPIYLYEEIENKSVRERIFMDKNIILFHESFFDNVINRHQNDAADIRNRLNEFTQKNKGFKVVYFSGSKNCRMLEHNIGHISVSALYQNLETFILHTIKGNADLRYLLFGENYNIEEFLLNELERANNEIEDTIENENPESKNLIAQTLQDEIPTVFDNADYITFFLDEKYGNQITDEYLNELIFEWFTENEYDNIFIPLCFGPTLSDFNGLRFATLMRCTSTKNQLKNIFIYGFVGYEYIINDPYFDILKTSNVFFIEYKKSAFLKSVELNIKPLTKDALEFEMKKVKIDAPKDYEGNHSVANEWAIHRWASALGINDTEIERNTLKVNGRLYFKYLNTIFPKSEIPLIEEKDLKINSSTKPKILHIDDEAEKGWYEIFCTILYDINGFDYYYLDDEFNGISREEIIEICLYKIREEEIDIVLLDFRLHADDFHTENIDDITGLRLLREIKKINPGIQVIIISATNKVWSLQALQRAGVDGFIIKERLENSYDHLFTIKSIRNLIDTFQTCSSKLFLKDFYNKLDKIKTELIPRKNKKAPNPLPKEFVDEVIEWSELSYKLLCREVSQPNKTAAFIFLQV